MSMTGPTVDVGDPLPAPELEAMKRRDFANTEKNFFAKINVLKRLSGADPGKKLRVLDYGSSWGYGLWQLRNAGFDAVETPVTSAPTKACRVGTSMGCEGEPRPVDH